MAKPAARGSEIITMESLLVMQLDTAVQNASMCRHATYKLLAYGPVTADGMSLYDDIRSSYQQCKDDLVLLICIIRLTHMPRYQDPHRMARLWQVSRAYMLVLSSFTTKVNTFRRVASGCLLSGNLNSLKHLRLSIDLLQGVLNMISLQHKLIKSQDPEAVVEKSPLSPPKTPVLVDGVGIDMLI